MKISIVIPSRERGAYLAHSLATVTAIDDPNLEIVVSDNASLDDTRAIAEGCGDARVKYVNTGARVSMRQNFELGLRSSTGDYVIMFGDDDGIIPGQFPMLRDILERHKPDTLSWNFLTYGWPIDGYGTKVGGVRLVRDNCFGTPERIDPAARLRQLEDGHSDISRPLPLLYHGCMSRAYLDRLRGTEGDYFKSMSPDLYISFRAVQHGASHGGDFLHIHHPFSINGFSPASTGGAMQTLGPKDSAGKEGGAKKTENSFLTEIKTDPLQDVIPVTKSMALAFLGTLQTVHSRYPDDPISPDYLRWYRLALIDQHKKDAATGAEIAASLDAHADQFGTHAELAAARKAGPPSGLEKLRTTLARNLAKLGSFRVSTEQGGENTIFTAAQTCDRLLGDHLADTLAGKMTRSAAWADARQRSRDFKRQL